MISMFYISLIQDLNMSEIQFLFLCVYILNWYTNKEENGERLQKEFKNDTIMGIGEPELKMWS